MNDNTKELLDACKHGLLDIHFLLSEGFDTNINAEKDEIASVVGEGVYDTIQELKEVIHKHDPDFSFNVC